MKAVKGKLREEGSARGGWNPHIGITEMATLTDEVKHEIVTALASFCGYAETARHIRACFGITVDRFQVRTYDPTNWAYSAGEKWRAIFDQARKAFLQQVADIPIAHGAYRLKQLQSLLDEATQAGNIRLAMKILERAAIEAGSIPAHELRYRACQSPAAEERRTHMRPLVHQTSSAFGSR